MARWIAGSLLVFALSTAASWTTINRPLDLRHDWLTAHTSINLEYMRLCGPRALGASILFLPGHELDCQSPFRLKNPGKRIYLSYPTGWLLFLYPPYSLARTAVPGTIPDYMIVRGMALLFIRLPLVALLLWWMHSIFSLSSFKLRSGLSFLLALATCTFLFSSPSYLHYTQNILFTDMFVLAPIYFSSMILHRNRKRKRITSSSGILLWFAIWLAVATDWYGAIWALLMAGWIAIDSRESNRRPLLLIFTSAAAVAAVHYLLQVYLLDPELTQIASTAKYRTGSEFSLSEYWNGLEISIRNTIFVFPWSPNAAQSIWPLLLFGTALTGALLLLFIERHGELRILLAPFLSGIIHLAVLTQHSEEHDFSVLKFGPAMVILLPCLVLAAVGGLNKLRGKDRLTENHRILLWISIILSIWLVYDASNGAPLHLRTSGQPRVNQDHLAMTDLGKRVVAPKEIPVTLEQAEDGVIPMEARGWDSPIGLALAGREIYTPERLLIYSSIMTQEANSYPILLLALSRKKGCNVGWQESGLQFQDKPIFLCRTGLSLRKYLELRVKEGD